MKRSKNIKTNDENDIKEGRKLPIRIHKTVTISKPVEEVYNFWHDLENLPRFMHHLESVQVLDDKLSHWVASGPAGTKIEWDAEITSERENELISWRSLADAEVDNAGSVEFKPAPANRGTEITVNLAYNPPGGKVGAVFAKLFGEEPSQQIEDDLRKFKQIMETGETATSAKRGLENME